MSETTDVTGAPQDNPAGSDTSPTVSATGNPSPTRRPGTFVPGHDARRNVAGRIQKKPTVLDETRKLAERKRKQVAQAHVNRMMREDATGNRAWAEYRDTFYGMPKQTLVLEQGESAGMAWLQQLAAQTVDGEATLLDDNPAP